MVKSILKTINKKRFVIEMPMSMAKIQSKILSLLPVSPILTEDQCNILAEPDNIVSDKHLSLKDLNIQPSDVEEAMKKWSSVGANICNGTINKKVFYEFPEEDRAILTFGNKQYVQSYSGVQAELDNVVMNPSFTFEIRENVVKRIKNILEEFETHSESFEKDKCYNLMELRQKIGHVCNLMSIPSSISDEICKEACKERQMVLGDSDKDELQNNINKALAYIQIELITYEFQKPCENADITKYMNECYKIFKKGEETVEHLLHVFQETHRFMTDLEIAKKAISKNNWIQDDTLYQKFMPTIHKSGFTYILTFMEKANILETSLWDKLEQGAMYMSATLSNPEKDGEYSFEDFFTEVGLPLSTPCHTTREVFDSSRVTIYVPKMKKYGFNTSFEYKKEYNAERVRNLTSMIKLNPLATLVLSNNIEDYKSIMFQMKKIVKTHKHVDYNKDVTLFHDFEQGLKNNYVIYGAEKLWTGLNLPGRIGLIVILKPFNKFRQLEEPYYTSIFQKYYKDHDINTIERFNSLYRYNTCRDTIQAAGRMMRKEDDGGVVMFLSDNQKDATMLKLKYEHANHVVGHMSSWPVVISKYF